jgi:hypothetical protein
MKNRASSVVELIVFHYLLGYLVPRVVMPSWVHRGWGSGAIMLDYGGVPIVIQPLNKVAD